MNKSTVDEIRARFDQEVQRFSNLETGQVAAMDSPLHMDLLTQALAAMVPDAQHVLDLGCGAGNYTLKLLQRLTGLQVTLVDLSQPMLDRAVERLGEVTDRPIHAIQSDVCDVDLGQHRYDMAMAAQCLHHLRDEASWEDVLGRIFKSLRPGGVLGIADSVAHDSPAIEAMMQQRWGDYLAALKNEAYRDEVFAYVEKEDTPRSTGFQLDLMRSVGFEYVEVLHKNNRFATLIGRKP